MEEGKRIELIVSLTLARLEILKLKYDGYQWSMVGEEGRKVLEETLKDIEKQLEGLKKDEK